MRKLILLLLLMASALAFADNQKLLEELDKAILQRPQYIKAKETRIDNLKQQLVKEHDSTAILKTINELYNEYYVFKFDSAMAYADKGLSLAKRQTDKHYIALFTIHKSSSLAIGGLYSEAINNLNTLNTEDIGKKLLFRYNFSKFLIYLYWTNYCNDNVFSPLYREKAAASLQQAMQYIDEDAQLYDYFMGEYHVYVQPDSTKARRHYETLISKTGENSRVYAMAAFALAGNYMNSGNQERYEEYIIKAALSDLKGCTMENMALQALAVHLFQKGEENIERAELYINQSMEDAKFYNNRLRILEISRILPQIMTSFQDTVKKQNNYLRYSVIFISLLVIGLLLTAFFIYLQNRKLATRRKELAAGNLQLTELNRQLSDSNKHQAELNDQLKELNQRLVDTNKHREGLASICIDLCAKYIDKLGKYQTLVKRKIKANQAQELLQTISSTRISEEDAATFLHRFDKAFLDLYPTFVEEFNALLNENGRIQLKTPNTLTTELRTFALIRLGVKSTADIAGLLFLSPQTIYNCRSVIRNKALNSETFDEDVQGLCTLISSN